MEPCTRLTPKFQAVIPLKEGSAAAALVVAPKQPGRISRSVFMTSLTSEQVYPVALLLHHSTLANMTAADWLS